MGNDTYLRIHGCLVHLSIYKWVYYQPQRQKLKSSLTAHIEKGLWDDCLVLVVGRVGFDVRTCDISYDIGLIPVHLCM